MLKAGSVGASSQQEMNEPILIHDIDFYSDFNVYVKNLSNVQEHEIAVRIQRDQSDPTSDFIMSINEKSRKAQFMQGNDPANFEPGSSRPTPMQLQQLCARLNDGKNLLEFRLISIRTKQEISSAVWAAIWLWEPVNRVCVFDIDGTITKSDSIGIATTVINYEGQGWGPAAVLNMAGIPKHYIHDGVIDVLTSISKHLNLLYLTARPITHEKILRKTLNDLRAPSGPLLTMGVPTAMSLATSHETFKTTVLERVRLLYPAAAAPDSSPFAAGFGNQQSDVNAYRSAGVSDDRIFLINKESTIRVPLGTGNFECRSYSALLPHLDAICQNQEPLPATPEVREPGLCFGDQCLDDLAGIVLTCCSPRAPANKSKPNRRVISAPTVPLRDVQRDDRDSQ